MNEESGTPIGASSPDRGGDPIPNREPSGEFAKARSDLLGLTGSDSRRRWLDAHDRTRQTSQRMTPQAIADAARWRAHQLMASNNLTEALSVLRNAAEQVPGCDFQGLIATVELHRGDFEKAISLAAHSSSIDGLVVSCLAAAHQLLENSSQKTEAFFAGCAKPRGRSVAAELRAQLAFMQGDQHTAARWSERAVDAGTEVGYGWRETERSVLDASRLLAQGRLDDFHDACSRGLEICASVGNHWSRHRLLHLQLHLAALQGDRDTIAHLVAERAKLEPTIPPLYLEGPLYGFGARLAAAEHDAGDYRANGTRSVITTIEPIVRRGYFVAVDRPILAERVLALASLRAKRRVGVQRLFARAIEFADERGWVLEAAIARVQLGEVSPILKLPRPDTSEAEAVLDGLDIDPVSIALTASRAVLLSQRATALTDREQEVLDLVADGLTAREIAARLGIAEETVRTHLKNARSKQGTTGLTGSRAAALIARARH